MNSQSTRASSGYRCHGWEHSDSIPRLHWNAPTRWDGGSYEVMAMILGACIAGALVTLVHILDSVGAI